MDKKFLEQMRVLNYKLLLTKNPELENSQENSETLVTIWKQSEILWTNRR